MFLKLILIVTLSVSQIFGASVIIREHFDQCGVMSASSGLIQGGQFSKQSQFPWIAIISIKHNSSNRWDHNGSGSLISRRHVLVKARYVSNYVEIGMYSPISTENIQIHLGTTIYNDLSQEGSMKIGVSKIKLYPNSRSVAPGFSILNFAILTLENDVIFSDFIKPVCLWNNKLNSRMYPSQQMMAVGYGRDLNGVITNIRKHVPVQVTSSNECAAEFEDDLTLATESRFFCVKSVVDDNGPCKFDTQLYVKVDSTWYLRGEMITVRTDLETGHCYNSYPIAAEDVAPYFDWISQEIEPELVEIFLGAKDNEVLEMIDIENIVKYEVN